MVQKGDRITSKNAVRLFEVGIIIIHIPFPAFTLVLLLPGNLLSFNFSWHLS